MRARLRGWGQMDGSRDIIVIGAGSAGIAAVEGAHDHDPSKSILLIDQDPHAPYKRTKLSKHLAKGYPDTEFRLRDDTWYREMNTELVTGTPAARIDREAKQVELSDGRTVSYGALVLAPGSEPIYPRIVRPHEAGSFFVLRSMDDAQRLMSALRRARTVLIDGMGVLALELADQLVAMQKKPTLVGATPQLMPRQLNARGAEMMEELLLRKRVKLLFQEEILSFEPDAKRGFDVTLLTHSGVYDVVLLCIGVQPRTGLAADAGLAVDRGIVVDDRLATSDPAIFCAGDAAQHPDGRVTHLWHAAEHQGRLAGANAAGGNECMDGRRFRLKTSVFGSYVFSLGLPRDLSTYQIEENEVENRYQAFYFRGGRLDGAVMFNDEPRARQYEQAVNEGWDYDRVSRELHL
ncbi:MAG: hypothetical protein EA403_14295 [Spirochaetaceae bacterium]|nr:MAG: hypothetical protein EA403_14295 [Spirochaetaceae bacterium]